MAPVVCQDTKFDPKREHVIPSFARLVTPVSDNYATLTLHFLYYVMDNQSSTVLQNTTNVYGDGSTLHTFFQRHKRPSDDGTTGALNKKPRIEVTTESQESQSQSPVEDIVEEIRMPRTNTFNMLRNMHRVRNPLLQPSSACPVVVGIRDGS